MCRFLYDSDPTKADYSFNTLVNLGPDGNVVAKYYKRMLFDSDGNNAEALTPSREALVDHFKANGTFTTNFGGTEERSDELV